MTGSREYPAFTNSIPPATTGPLPFIDPPWAGISLTVEKSFSVLKSQMVAPLRASLPYSLTMMWRTTL